MAEYISLSAMAKTTIKKKTSKSKSKSQFFTSLDFTPGFWKRHWREAIIIPVLAFALYWMCLPYGYVLDDQIVITGNDYTKKGFNGIWKILSTESFSGYFHGQQDLVAGARYRPLSIVSFAMEQSIFGDNQEERHFVNILLYGLIGLLIFRVVAILFPEKETKHWLTAIPFLAVVLYILHPVHSEVVANIKGRDEIMTGIGAMGALYFVLRYLYSKHMIWLVASGICMFFGLMSKENAITFLAVIPLTMYFFTNAKRRDYLITAVPSLIAAVIYIIIRTNVIGFVFSSGKKITDLMNDPFVEMNSAQRYATILYTLGQYIRLLIFPHPLTHDYYPYHIPIMDWGKPGTLISLAIYLGLAYVFFKFWKRKSIYAWAIGFFIATVSIISNLFFPVGTFMNERFIFIPSIAFSVVCAWVFVKHGMNAENKTIRFVSIGFLILLMTAYIFKTYVRVPAWKDSMSLNGQAAMVSVNSARNNCFMGTALFEEARTKTEPAAKKELLDEADYYVDKSLKMYPKYTSGNQIKSGLVAERYLRDGDLPRLLADFTTILMNAPHTEYVPQFLDFLNGRAPHDTMLDFYYKTGYEILGKTNKEYPTAIIILKLGEKIAPDDPRILYGLGKSYYIAGDQVQGTKYLDRAYQINPALRDLQ